MTRLIELTTACNILAFQLALNPFPKPRSPVDVITKHLFGFFIGLAISTDNKGITEFKGSMYKLGIVGFLPTLSSQMTDDSFWHRRVHKRWPAFFVLMAWTFLSLRWSSFLVHRGWQRAL